MIPEYYQRLSNTMAWSRYLGFIPSLPFLLYTLERMGLIKINIDMRFMIAGIIETPDIYIHNSPT